MTTAAGTAPVAGTAPDVAATTPEAPLTGRRVGVTSTRKAAELRSLLERRGAVVVEAPLLQERPLPDDAALRRATERVLTDGVDVLVATTGTGVAAWWDAALRWGLAGRLTEALSGAEILARGPKAVGALRSRGLAESWQTPTERLDDVLTLLRARDLRGCRLVLQEHGQSLAVEAEALRRAGAAVTLLSTYRSTAAADLTPAFGLVDQAVTRRLDAVTFTSAAAVSTLLRVAGAAGLQAELVAALRRDVVAMCVGPVTADAWLAHGVPAPYPARSRLAAMVRALEQELASRPAAVVVAGRLLVAVDDAVTLDGVPVRLARAPHAVLRELLRQPGAVVPRRQLLASLPSRTATSEHAVEMAVARLRAAIGATAVQTVVKRGYRLHVG